MKNNIPKICYIVSAVLAAVFVIRSIVDYSQYSTALNSAPFYVWVLVDALYFLIPVIVVLVIGFITKKER